MPVAKEPTFAEVAERMGLKRPMLYDLATAAKVLGVTWETLNKACNRKKLHYWIDDNGRKKMVRPEWVDEWIKEGTR